MKIAVCFFDNDDKIVSQRYVTAEWSPKLESNMKKLFDVDIQKEVAGIMYKELTNSITKEVLSEMLAEITEKKG